MKAEVIVPEYKKRFELHFENLIYNEAVDVGISDDYILEFLAEQTWVFNCLNRNNSCTKCKHAKGSKEYTLGLFEFYVKTDDFEEPIAAFECLDEAEEDETDGDLWILYIHLCPNCGLWFVTYASAL